MELKGASLASPLSGGIQELVLTDIKAEVNSKGNHNLVFFLEKEDNGVKYEGSVMFRTAPDNAEDWKLAQYHQIILKFAAVYGCGAVLSPKVNPEDPDVYTNDISVIEKEIFAPSKDNKELAENLAKWVKKNAIGTKATWKILVSGKYLNLPFKPDFVASKYYDVKIEKQAGESFTASEAILAGGNATPNDGAVTASF